MVWEACRAPTAFAPGAEKLNSSKEGEEHSGILSVCLLLSAAAMLFYRG